MASLSVPCFDSLFLIAQERLSHDFAMEGGTSIGKDCGQCPQRVLLVAWVPSVGEEKHRPTPSRQVTTRSCLSRLPHSPFFPHHPTPNREANCRNLFQVIIYIPPVPHLVSQNLYLAGRIWWSVRLNGVQQGCREILTSSTGSLAHFCNVRFPGKPLISTTGNLFSTVTIHLSLFCMVHVKEVFLHCLFVLDDYQYIRK